VLCDAGKSGACADGRQLAQRPEDRVDDAKPAYLRESKGATTLMTSSETRGPSVWTHLTLPYVRPLSKRVI